MTITATNLAPLQPNRNQSVLVFSTKGSGSNEETRIVELLSAFKPSVGPFDRTSKFRSMQTLIRQVIVNKPRLVVMEGTGVAGGMVCLIARMARLRYVISSGDAVGPWVGTKSAIAAPFFAIYERLLTRFASGYIGWTPYLVGRALTFGVPRAMTAAGWSPITWNAEAASKSRENIRRRYDIPDDAIVVGIVGSLVWSKDCRYSYGLELVNAALKIQRRDIIFLIVGDGDGLPHLKRLAGSLPNVRFTGRVSQDETIDYMAAMDLGSLPQSVDKVGSFRYTTKISEYLMSGLPVVTGQIPLAYDFQAPWLWRLPGSAPWDSTYIDALVQLLETLTCDELGLVRTKVPRNLPEFNKELQVQRATNFIRDILNEIRP
jgi:glycosyltransferase involved in cell wall biosynthesis